MAHHEEYRRTVRLAEDANLDTVKAVCIDGLLQVTVDKKPPPAPLNLEVQPSQYTPPPPVTSDATAADHEPPAYEFREEVPGVSPSEVTVKLVPQVGHHPTASYHLSIHAASAKGFGTYRFRYSLPDDAVAEGASAHCCNGLLHVRVPRRAPLRVTVPVADAVSASTSDQTQQSLVELVHIKAAGCSAHQLKLEATPGLLRVDLHQEDSDRDTARVERQLVALPEGLDLHTLHATCVDGLLTVSAAAPAPPQPTERAVEVTAERPAVSPAAAAGAN